MATFASNIHRVQQSINAAEKFGRKVAVCGRSMSQRNGLAAWKLVIWRHEGIMVDIDDINKYPDEQIVIITTGSQGEPMSALLKNGSLRA